MKFSLAIVLVVVSMVAAEAPRPAATFARQTAAPYQSRGWRPAGPSFNLPLKSQKQQQLPTPAPSYGPPPQQYGPPPEEATTTEQPSTTTEEVPLTTEQPQAENIKIDPRTNNNKGKAEKLQQEPQQNPAGQVYVVLPQGQNFLYQIPQSAPLVARANIMAAPVQSQKPSLIPLQAVPAFAKLQEVPQLQQLQYVQAPYQVASTQSVFTPFSRSFVQIYQ